MKIHLLSATILSIAFAVSGQSAVNVPLTVQEAIYPGSIPGIARSADPVTVGIPLPDDPTTGVTDPNQLTLTGASVGQFRVLGRWPSGRIKWVLVDTQASVAAGGANTSIVLTSGGTGNFGGSNLATDNGGTITVATGTATFTIKKANFNVFDIVDVGSTHVVLSGASSGLVISGPTSPATSCGVCTTLYQSSNDSGSTVVIEENGPAKTVLKATGAYRDASGNAYLNYTLRMYFYRNRTAVGLVHVRRNADHGTSNTFATAYKGFQSDELRIKANITGDTFSIATHTGTPTTGTVSGLGAYIYQGQSSNQQYVGCAVGTACANKFTTDSGYTVANNGSTVTSGTSTQWPQGWADFQNGSSVGVEIGVPEFASRWPVSLEDRGSGDIRIGIAATQNSQPHYQSWPQWYITPMWVNFHASAPASLPNEFLKAQHYLLGRASRTQYNSAGVFPLPIIDSASEATYYDSVGSSASPSVGGSARYCCFTDLGTTDPGNYPLAVYRKWGWSGGGADTEIESRWSNLLGFIKSGSPGRFMDARNFYRMSSAVSYPQSDGFDWRDQSRSELDGFGQPRALSADADKALCGVETNAVCSGGVWHDREHWHDYGSGDYYFMTGDETVKDGMAALKDWFLNNWSYQGGFGDGYGFHLTTNGTTTVTRSSGSISFNADFVNRPIVIDAVQYRVVSVTDGDHLVVDRAIATNSDILGVMYGGLYNTRSVATSLLYAVRHSEFLNSIGDSDYSAVLAQAVRMFEIQIKPPLCLSGYPSGCNFGPVAGGPWLTQGISPVRGVHLGATGPGAEPVNCGYSTARRVAGTFQQSIMAHAIWELAKVKGTGWSDYWNALDLAYGQAQWALNEAFADNGGTDWSKQGFRFGLFLDEPSACSENYPPGAFATNWSNFYVSSYVTGKVDWERKFQVAFRRLMGATGNSAPDFYQYEIGATIHALQTAGTKTLQDTTVTSVTDNGGGSYTIHWTTPPGTDYLRIKYGPKRIVDWIGFNAGTNTFIGDPTTTMNWFAATNATGIPVPVAGDQSMTIATGLGVGLTAANFSVKAFSGVGGSSPAPSGSLVMVSGNVQSGTPGTALASAFVVKVTDAGGNPVSGATVTFTVTGGGGTLSSASSSTNSLGVASTVLTLGSAPGINTVVAASGTLIGSPMTFTATGTAVPVSATSVVLVSGNGQTGVAGRPLASPLVVKATDGSGNPVSGVTVTFTVTAGGGVLAPTTATTDTAGLASTTLTLGPSAGSNAVTAVSGSLSGSPITFTATASAATGSAPTSSTSVNWTVQPRTAPWPDFIGWFTAIYDPVSQQTMWYLAPTGYSGIYSTHMFFYNSTTGAFTDMGGTSSIGNACPADTPSMPADRHPIGQMALDTTRNFLWIYGGVNINCPDNPHQDMYYLTLNTNPMVNTWHRVTPAHYPAANGYASMVYDPDDDVLFAFGSDGGAQNRDNWVYCRTAENPTPGTLTARQAAAGCANPDDWSPVAVAGGLQPPGVSYPGLDYDVVTKKVIAFGGEDGGTNAKNETWAYDVPSRTWTRKGLATVAPPAYTGPIVAAPAKAYNSTTGKILYHQTSNTGAPADWQYDPVADTWSKLISTGGGAPIDATGVYDPKNNVFLTWNKNISSGFGEIWKGTLAAGGTPVSSCDLNADGTVNALDVQLAIQQALGVASCSADINGDTQCNVIDIQRVINASLSGVCSAGH